MATQQFHANPFPGIRSFEITESHLFFGREQQVGELVEKLTESRFLAIVGSSGCGKSSLIKAGLIPQLQLRNGGENPSKWKLALFRPADDPIGNLAAAVAGDRFFPDSIAESMRSGSENLVTIFRKKDQPDVHYLIVVDQFEELFRFKKSKSSFRSILDASTFIDLMLQAVGQTEIPIYIALSMRTDFLDDCTEFRGLSEIINRGYYLVPRMTNEERRKAITGPVFTAGARITDGLLDQLLEDVGEDPDQLPIMQHALMRTWDYWTLNRVGDQPIDLEHYQAIGTMKEALSVHLEEIYADLREHRYQFHAEKLFKALTDITRESRGTRRPTQLQEICTLAAAREEEIMMVIDKFRAPGCAFLMPSASVPLSPDTTIDISHESIMRVWTRLRIWVEEESQSAQLYLRLSKSAELYQEGRTGLWVNPELQLALQWKEQARPNATWASRYDPAFDRAMTFLDHSKKHYELELSRKEKQQKRNLKRARTSAIILGIASLVSILFLIISLNLRFKAEASRKEALEKEKLAVFERKKSEEQRKEAILQKKISEQQQQIAEQQEMITEQQRQYAVTQQRIAEQQTTVAVEQRKQADISKQEAIVARDEAQLQRKEAVSQRQIADQERIKAEESEKKAQQLRLLAISRSMAIQAQQLHSTQKDDYPALLAVTAYQLYEANGGTDNDPTIYSALSAISADAKVMRGHTDAVRAIAITKNGTTLYSCGDDNNVFRWNLNDPAPAPVGLKTEGKFRHAYRALALSSDDKLLAAGTTWGKILLWQKDTPDQAPVIINAHTSIIHALVAHPALRRFFSCSSDGKVLQWDITAGAPARTLIDSLPCVISALAVSNDGRYLAYGTTAGNLFIRDLQDQAAAPARLPAFKSSVISIRFSNNGNYIAAGCQDGSIQIINRNDLAGQPIAIIGRHLSGVTSLSFGQADRELASASFDWSVKIAGFPASEAKPISIESHELWVYQILYTPDYRHLISCSADKTVRMFSTYNSEMAAQLRKKLGRNLTPAEWKKMVGEDIPYQKTREDLP